MRLLLYSLAIAALLAAVQAATTEAFRNVTTVDYVTPRAEDTARYDRCKATHRCNRANSTYTPRFGLFEFQSRRITKTLVQTEQADMFLDFEDWTAGTVGLGMDHAYLLGQNELTRGAHFNSWEERHAIPPDPTEEDIMAGAFDYNLVVNASANVSVHFDTSELLLSITDWDCGGGPPCNWTVPGHNSLSDNGTEVAVFNFLTIYLSPNTTVTMDGNRSLTIISRSTAVWDTPLHVAPGTLGAFPKTGAQPSPFNNNYWGPGSGAKRVYMQTLDTFAEDIDEVQTITTQGDVGQTIRGGFTLAYRGDATPIIAANAEPEEVKRSIESNLFWAGNVTVTRSPRAANGAHTWTVTFDTALGDVPQLEVTDALTGLGHHVFTNTTVEGNTLQGSFQLEVDWGFGPVVTDAIPADVTEEELERICMDAWGPQNGFGLEGSVHSVHVTRTDPTMMCDHGLCQNGPQGAWGYTYFITAATNQTVVSPTSPTRPDSPSFDQLDAFLPVRVSSSNLTSSVEGAPANVTIVDDIEQGLAPMLALHNFSSPVTVTFGGNGGSNGGFGGDGHARHTSADPVNNRPVYDLVAGSSGSRGGETAQDALSPDVDTAAGGSGGGALELIAANDLIIGPSGGVSVDGQDGDVGLHGGGGGSGGTVLLSAGGVLVIHSAVHANGGDGGDANADGGRGGGGGGGGRIAGYAQSLNVVDGGYAEAVGGAGGDDAPPFIQPFVEFPSDEMIFYPFKSYNNGRDRTNDTAAGDPGTVYLTTAGGALYRTELSGGAEETQRSLKLTVDEAVLSDSGVEVRAPFANNGPAFMLPSRATGKWLLRRGGQADITAEPEVVPSGSSADGGLNTGSTPKRVTAYMRVAPPKDGLLDTHWGAHLAIHDSDFRPLVTGEQRNAPPGNFPGADGGAGSGGPGSDSDVSSAGDSGEGGGEGGDAVAIIGVALVNGVFKHGANYRHTPGVELSPQSPQTVAFRNAQADTWYKVDIYINWVSKTYKVRINDVTVALDIPFVADSAKRIGLYTFHAGTVWFDEVFAGEDYALGFECPATLGDEALRMFRPVQTGWNATDVGPDTTHHDIKQATSHLSTRQAFQSAAAGFVRMDGEPHRAFFEDVATRPAEGDHSFSRGGVNMGALVYVSPEECAEDANGRYYWYGDHRVDTDGDTSVVALLGGDLLLEHPGEQGGAYACSTDDFLTWRNEGIMLYDLDLNNSVTPLEVQDSTPRAEVFFRNERPKVIYNAPTNTFVMWMYVDNFLGSLRLAGTATSRWPNGPFTFQRSLLPDGNQTTDLTVFRQASGVALMARTYYENKTFYLPRPIMQPIWESVKLPDHTPTNVQVDYALNYHRAYYHAGYDNRDDIFLQRFRTEDQPWYIVIENNIETYDPASDTFQLLTVGEDGNTTVRYSPAERQDTLAELLDENTFRAVLGQGQPPILSRFKDPTNQTLSAWRPSSVVSVRAQSWEQNYLDKNLVDNPVHQTVADLLIGPHHVVEVRRTKYVAISLLSDDYLDVSGVLEVLEGEMEDEEDLIVLLSAYGGFQWQAGLQPGDIVDVSFTSTYPTPTDGTGAGLETTTAAGRFDFATEFDWETRHWQFLETAGDRRNSFKNFRDQQVNLDCPALHNATQAKQAECADVLANRTPIVPEEAQINYLGELDIHSEAIPTDLYERCQQELTEALLAYQQCIRDQLVDFNTLDPWGVGSRECVGGGGECGPPENGERPSPATGTV